MKLKTSVALSVITMLLICAYAHADTGEGIVSYWMFDEGSGTTASDFIGDNDGTLVNGPVWTTGIIDGALQFDGVDDYVALSENAVKTTEFTLAIWANHYGPGGGADGANRLFSQRDASVGDNHSAVVLSSENAIGQARAAIRSSSGSVQFLDAPKKDYNEWHHYAITVDSTDFIFYIDGVEVNRTTNNQAGDYVTAINYVDIARGKSVEGDRAFLNGAVDEMLTYDRALSDTEVQDLYLNGPSGIELSIAIAKIEDAVVEKSEMLEQIDQIIDKEWDAYEALEEVLASGDYGDLKEQDITKALKKIEMAIDSEERLIDPLEKSIIQLENVLKTLGWEPEPGPEPNGPEPDPNLVSYWEFNEGSGTTALDSVGTNDGTLINGPVWTTGLIDGALQFDGVDDYVNVGDPADENLDFGADDSFSIAAWIKCNKPTSSAIATKRRSTGLYGYFEEGYILRVNNGKLRFNIEDTSNIVSPIDGLSDIADDQWHHVVGVRDTAQDKLYVYVDGVSDATPVTDNTISTLATSQNFWIGLMTTTVSNDPLDSPHFFGGLMDEVLVYDAALSPEQVLDLYENGI